MDGEGVALTTRVPSPAAPATDEAPLRMMGSMSPSTTGAGGAADPRGGAVWPVGGGCDCWAAVAGTQYGLKSAESQTESEVSVSEVSEALLVVSDSLPPEGSAVPWACMYLRRAAW